MKRNSILLLLLFTCFGISAQENCVNYHQSNCLNAENNEMQFDSQSKSTTLGGGQIAEFHMVGYEGLDYKITICHEEILGNQIRFKVYQKKQKMVKPNEAMENETAFAEEVIMVAGEDAYKEGSGDGKDSKFRLVKELLYDNSEDNYTNELDFTAAGSLSLILEISVVEGKSKNKSATEELGCVGVLVEHIKTPL